MIILEILKIPDQEKQSELRTIRITDISEDNTKKLIHILVFFLLFL